jgi:hypothetical protein
MVHKKPLSINAFLKVKGVGKVKLELYGKLFISKIVEFLNSENELIVGFTYKSLFEKIGKLMLKTGKREG